MEYASKGVATAGLTTGIIGTGLGVLGSGILGNMFTNPTNHNYVDKDTLALQMQLVDAQKENAILAADLSSEKKMVEVFNAANNKIASVRDELNASIHNLEAKVDANAASQAVINAQYGSQINLNTSQISQLFALTKLTIPNSSVNPGWGNVCIMPTGCGTISSTGTTTA